MPTPFNAWPIEDQNAFNLYKGNSPHLNEQCTADYLNNSLRNGATLTADWEKLAQRLDALIANAPMPDEIMLYRATVDDFVVPFIANNEYVYPAFMSTSVDEGAIYRHFSNSGRQMTAALLRIRCPAGSMALNLEANPSFGGHEQEFLLARRSKFKITFVDTVTEQQSMDAYMTPYYAKHYSSLKIYELEYVGV